MAIRVPQDRMIHQIIPATGWFAVYKDEEQPNGEWRTPLVCWVLCDSLSDETRDVTAMIATDSYVDFVDDGTTADEVRAGFLRYEQEVTPAS